MGFRVASEHPLRQHALIIGVLAGVLVVASTPWFAMRWAMMIDVAPPHLLVVVGLMTLHTLVFYGVCLAFHRVDMTDRPAFVARHRIQQERRKHPPMDQTLRVLTRNQFLFLPLLLYGLTELLLLRGWMPESELPTLGRLAWELVAQGVIAVVVFYGSHRFLHRKWWMKRVHRVHHEFKTTTAWASEYAHPVEFMASNFATLATGAVLLAPHLASMYLFALLSLLTILVHHSGYALPWAPYAIPHDWHHYKVHELFGTTGMIDRVMGTDTELRRLREEAEGEVV